MSGHEADIDAFITFEQQLQDALGHLYDPAYRPSLLLRQVLHFDAQQANRGLRMAILQAIDELKPEPNVPDNARVKRVYETLYYKYVSNLSQEETAERLGITSRHLRREQPEVVHALALYLWEKDGAGRSGEADVLTEVPLAGWRSQVKEEITSLQRNMPNTIASISEVVESVVQLESGVVSSHGVRLDMSMQNGLLAVIHPAALRQVLITAIGQLVQAVPGGQIVVRADQAASAVRLTISGQPLKNTQPLDASFISEILHNQSGSVSVSMDQDRAAFLIELQVAEFTVLVVDDNLDLAHLYRRYTVGTRFNIVHVAQGERALSMVETYKPSVVVLDVMLPDMDGWLLLSQLRENPASRSIPIIVCSVVREEELARALGARSYLQKPVQRQQFIQALSQVLTPAAEA